jgi:hypothetical protein
MEIILLLALGIAVLRWGANSIDSLNSPEWKRRQERGGFFQLDGMHGGAASVGTSSFDHWESNGTPDHLPLQVECYREKEFPT